MDERFLETSEATQEEMRDRALANVSSQAFSNTDLEPEMYKALVCTDCEVELPLFRKQKGFTLCVVCQTGLERRKGRQIR